MLLKCRAWLPALLDRASPVSVPGQFSCQPKPHLTSEEVQWLRLRWHACTEATCHLGSGNLKFWLLGFFAFC